MLITVVGFEDMVPSPRVEVTVTSLDADVVSVRIFVVSEDGQFPVRDAEPLEASASAFITDYECPIGVPIAYVVDGYDVAGVLVESEISDPLTVGGILPDEVIIQDPLVPELAVKVEADAAFAGSLNTRRSSARYRAGGRTVVLLGEPGLLEAVNLHVFVTGEDPTEDLRDVLQAGVVLVRTMSPIPLNRRSYFAIADVPSVPLDHRFGGTSWLFELVGDEVSRDVLAVLTPLVTYQRYIDTYATYAEIIADYPTYLSLLTDPPPDV